MLPLYLWRYISEGSTLLFTSLHHQIKIFTHQTYEEFIMIDLRFFQFLQVVDFYFDPNTTLPAHIGTIIHLSLGHESRPELEPREQVTPSNLQSK